MIRRRAALPGLGALLLAGCAARPRRAGRPGGDEGGIGGTGIFGTVTATGADRLSVNGLGIGATPATLVETLALRAGRILPGDVVAVEALRRDGRLLARRIALFHPLVGPLEHRPGGGFAVLGTTLRVAPGALPPGVALAPGQPVAVSGLWHGETVAATALLPLDRLEEAVARGLLRGSQAGVALGGTRIAGAAPEPGRFATLRGAPLPGGLALRHAETAPLAVFAGTVERLAVEGFLARDPEGPGVHLAGFGLPLDPASPALPPVDERRLFLGRHDGRFRVADSLALPEDAAARREFLDGPAPGPALARWLDG